MPIIKLKHEKGAEMHKKLSVLIASLSVQVLAVAALEIDQGKICSGGVWDASLGSGKTFVERELSCWGWGTCSSWGDEEIYVPVLGTGTITPIILHGNTKAADLGTVKILTDQQMMDRFTPKGVSPSKWDGDGSDYEYETANGSWEWPSHLWGKSTKAKSDRRWIQIPIKMSTAWSGLKTFQVALKGTDQVTETPLRITPAWDDWDGPGHLPLTFSQLCRGLSIGGSGVKYGYDAEVIYAEDGTDWFYGQTRTVEISNFSKTQNVVADNVFTIKLPEAGTLVVVVELDDDIESLADYKARVKVTGEGISKQSYNYYRYDTISDGDAIKLGIRDDDMIAHRITVSKATTLTVTEKGLCELEGVFKFYPAAKRSVYVNVFDDWNVWYCGPSGYVTGSGSYKEGETVTLKAVTASGQKFLRWDWCYGVRPANWESIRTNPTLSFKVTSGMAGSAAAEKQIYLQPVWEDQIVISAVPKPFHLGTVTGGGPKVVGTKAVLTPKPMTGYHCVGWTDDPSLPGSARTVVVNRGMEGPYEARFAINDYSIKFHANGGTGTMPAVTGVKYTTSVVLPKNAFKRANCVFKGWATSATGKVAYANAASVSKLTATHGGTVTLYAVWAPASTMTMYIGEAVDYKFPTLASYKASTLPAGLKWSSSTSYGRLTGKPTKVQTVSVTFTKGSSKIVVKMAVKKDEILTATLPKIYGGEPNLDINLGVKSYAGAAKSVTVSGLPQGLSFVSGHIVGHALEAGTKNAKITIVSAVGTTITKTLPIKVDVPAACLKTREFVLNEEMLPDASYILDESREIDNFAPNALFEVKSDGTATFKTLRGTLAGNLKFDAETFLPYVRMTGAYKGRVLDLLFNLDADGHWLCEGVYGECAE